MSQNFTKFDCEQWLKKKTVNPITGRTIKVGGSVYKALEKACEEKKVVKAAVSKQVVKKTLRSKWPKLNIK